MSDYIKNQLKSHSPFKDSDGNYLISESLFESTLQAVYSTGKFDGFTEAQKIVAVTHKEIEEDEEDDHDDEIDECDPYPYHEVAADNCRGL